MGKQRSRYNILILMIMIHCVECDEIRTSINWPAPLAATMGKISFFVRIKPDPTQIILADTMSQFVETNIRIDSTYSRSSGRKETHINAPTPSILVEY